MHHVPIVPIVPCDHHPPSTKHHAQCTMHHPLYHVPSTMYHARTVQQQCNYCQDPPSVPSPTLQCTVPSPTLFLLTQISPSLTWCVSPKILGMPLILGVPLNLVCFILFHLLKNCPLFPSFELQLNPQEEHRLDWVSNATVLNRKQQFPSFYLHPTITVDRPITTSKISNSPSNSIWNGTFIYVRFLKSDTFVGVMFDQVRESRKIPLFISDNLSFNFCPNNH